MGENKKFDLNIFQFDDGKVSWLTPDFFRRPRPGPYLDHAPLDVIREIEGLDFKSSMTKDFFVKISSFVSTDLLLTSIAHRFLQMT